MGRISYDNKAFIIDGRHRFIYSGEIHYFRVPRELWKDRIIKAKRAYLNCISSYIPWNWHEFKEKVFIFNNEKDIEFYINLCKELGLFFIARPGPYICSEWDNGGHPNWLFMKTKIFRTLDKEYFTYAKRWYDIILPIIARNSINEGGPVILLQIENEYFWGNIPFLLKLYEIAKEYVGDLPVITNENKYIRGTEIIDTLDSYPTPWQIEEFDKKIEEYINEQKEKPKMFMELEGGWFSTFGSKLPTCRGSFPASWTEILIKTAIGYGLNGINIYMFHGGTNPEYFTAKYITTSYDYEAAIDEYGKLTDRYYVIKRIGAFLKYFENYIVNSVFKGYENPSCKENVKVLRRVHKNVVINFVRNLANKTESIELCSNNEKFEIELKPRSMKIILTEFKLADGILTIDYCTSEPLALLDYGDAIFLVFYDERNTKGKVKITAENIKARSLRGEIKLNQLNNNSVIINYSHADKDIIVEVKTEASTKTLYLIFINKLRASRTWEIETNEGNILLITTAYFLKEYDYNGKNIVLNLELDEMPLEDMLIITPFRIKKVLLNDVPISLDKITEHLYEVQIKYVKRNIEPKIELNDIYFSKINFENTKLIEIQPYTPLELASFLENGYYLYKIFFDTNKRGNINLFFSYFNDYLIAYLNEKLIARGYRSLESEVNLKSKNTLFIILEATGHNNDGLLSILNGITGGIYINKLKEYEIKEWYYYEISRPEELLKTLPLREADVSKYLNNPLESYWFSKIISSKSENYCTVNSIDKHGVYECKIKYDGKGYWLLEVTSPEGFVLVFLNDKYVGACIPADRGKISVFELNKYLKKGENRLTLLAHGKCKSVIVKVYEEKITGKWFVNKLDFKRLKIEEWNKVNMSFPISFEGKATCIKGKFKIEIPKALVAPLKLYINSDSRGLIFINGKLIGRYVPEGPQNEFYIPEPLIRKENEFMIILFNLGDKITLHDLKIKPHYVHETVKMEFQL